MIEVTLLGTGGTVPLPGRYLTSLLVRWSGHEMLIDCGEGTQISMKERNLPVRHIDAVAITHYHADHTAGLPGLLLSMAKADRTEPIDIYGPKGLHELMEGVNLIARYIPFEIREHELEKDEGFVIDNLQVTSFPLRHSVPCIGYQMDLKRSAQFDKDKAIENGVPMKYWGRLQKGNTIEEDGVVYTPDLVLGRQRRGLKIVYATDTRPVNALQCSAQDADLLITEGMYGDNEKIDKAKNNRHMMMEEACTIARNANVKRLWLTHYSPSMHQPDLYQEACDAIFAGTVISKDGQHMDLSYDNRETGDV